MKKFLLVSAFSFSLVSAFAQIVVEATDFPTAGEFIYQGTDTLVSPSITPGNAGASQTWDFSGLQTVMLDTNYFEDPDNVGGSNFPTAFLAVEQFGGWGFIDSVGSDVNITGFIGDFTGFGAELEVHFTDPQTIFVFPSTYQTSYTDTSVIDVKFANNGLIPIPGVDSIRFKRVTYTDSEMDGYGSVITPLATYDALRQHNVEINTDTAWIYFALLGGWNVAPSQGGFENPSLDTAYRYRYIIKEIGYYAVNLTTDENDSIINATFLSDPSLCCTGIGEPNHVDAFSMYPNPATNDFFINVPNPSKLAYTIFDITGKQVLEGSLTANLTNVNTSLLSSGLYVCRISSTDGKLVGAQKLSIAGK